MHQPRQYGSFGVESTDDARAIEALARRLTNIKGISGLDSLTISKVLPSGLIARATDAGGVFRVHVQQPPPPPPDNPPEEVVDKAYIPALFCGAIKKSIVLGDEGVEIELTQQSRRRLSGYLEVRGPVAPQPSVPAKVKLQRFRIRYNPLVDEFNPKSSGNFVHTQYVQQRPTWYSGAMAEVVQIVGGYGRRDFENLPKKDKIEQLRVDLPHAVRLKIELQRRYAHLPGYTGAPHKSGEFQYDYKYNNTDGVGFDTDKKPWLVRVNTKGVFAMPLPIVPATTTKAFREYIDEQSDDELLWILDRFGGMPSGEGFPNSTKDFDAWTRAGVIIKVCEVGDFYQHLMYSSACGWAFNSSGTEGFNTCYDYDEGEHIGYGLAYKLSLKLGAAEFDGRLAPGFDLTGHFDARALDAYMSSLYRALTAGNAHDRAIKYKLARSLPEILKRLDGLKNGQIDVGAEIEFWDKLKCDPIATHSGSVNQVGRGWLYHGAKFMYQPQIKFPEPFMGGCVSHDFLPLLSGRYKKEYPRCDTIMFGYYIGDQLKTVKYFRDGRTFNKAVEDDFEECMIVGSWQRTTTLSPVGLRGHFYTSDFDDRSEDIVSVKVEKIVGEDLGYDHTPWFEFDAPFWIPGTMWRNRYFTQKNNTTTVENSAGESALCIPYLNRNALLYATRESSSETQIESLALHHIQDPNTYRYWTYDFVMHWAGSLPVMKGRPYPKDGNPVWVEMHEYNPGPCTDFADRGDWVGGLPANYTWLIHPQANVWMLSGGGGAPPVKGYVKPSPKEEKESAQLQVSILEQTGKVHKAPQVTYFLGSPGEFGDVFYRDATRVLAGKAVYANVMGDDTSGKEPRKRFGHTRSADHMSAHHFIGVINE